MNLQSNDTNVGNSFRDKSGIIIYYVCAFVAYWFVQIGTSPRKGLVLGAFACPLEEVL